MKKILSVMLFAFMALQFTNATDIVAQESDKLPVEARNFITQNFPQATISHVKVDKKLMGSDEYEVLFSNGMKMEFDSRGNWKEIEMKNDKMPVAVIPGSVNTYVQNTYSANHITKIEHDNDGYKVKLNNGLELKFDQAGTFKKVDD